jgi:predicted permease
VGDYFQALGIPLLRGRFFTELDREDSALVVILSEQLSRTFWPGQDPIGRNVTLRGKQHMVVGIVGDLRDSYDYDAAPKYYVPLWQHLDALKAIVLVLRTNGDPPTLVGTVSREVLLRAPGTIVTDVRTMEQIRTGFLSTRRFLLLLLGLFAGAALLLAAAGIYGVNSYAVSRRTQEIGVRMAIGAQSRDVIHLFMKRSLGLVVIGLGFGTLGALAVTRILSSILYGVAPTDPATFAGVAMLLIAVAALSCYLPARRATRVDPMAALRCGG